MHLLFIVIGHFEIKTVKAFYVCCTYFCCSSTIDRGQTVTPHEGSHRSQGRGCLDTVGIFRELCPTIEARAPERDIIGVHTSPPCKPKRRGTRVGPPRYLAHHVLLSSWCAPLPIQQRPDREKRDTSRRQRKT